MAAHHINQTNSINHKSIWVDTINATDLCTAATPPLPVSSISTYRMDGGANKLSVCTKGIIQCLHIDESCQS